MIEKILVKFVDTGHTNQFNDVCSPENLKLRIEQKLKISINDQRLISKQGFVLTNKDTFEGMNRLKQTFVNDPTRTISGMSKIPTVYLINLRILQKVNLDVMEKQSINSDSVQFLKRRHETCSGLRQKIFQFKSLKQSLNSSSNLQKILKFSPQAYQMVQKLHEIILKFVDNYYNYKQNKQCIEQYNRLIQNQRKGGLILFNNFLNTKKLIKQIRQNYKEIERIYQQKEKVQVSVKNNFEEIKTKCHHIYNKQLKYNKEKIQTLFSEEKQKHKKNQKCLKEIDGEISKQWKNLESFLFQMKKIYTSIIQAIMLKCQRNCQDVLKAHLIDKFNYQSKFTKYCLISEQLIKKTQERFHEEYVIHSNNQKQFKKNFQQYDFLLKFFEQIEQKCCSLQQPMCDLIKKLSTQHKKFTLQQNFMQPPPQLKNKVQSQNSCKSLENNQSEVSVITNKYISLDDVNLLKMNLAEREQRQINRRKYFNKKLFFLNQELKEIMRQQKMLRTKFRNNQFVFNEQYNHPVLENINVPCFLLNFDETTDRQISNSLFNKSGGVNRFEQNLQQKYNLNLFKASNGMQRVLQELDQIKNCQTYLKKDISQQSAIKNLTTIIERSSQIFHHIYSQKITQYNKRFQNKQRHLQFRIGNLQRQNSELKINLQNYSQKNGCSQSQKIWLQQKYLNLDEQFNKHKVQSQKQIERSKKQIDKHQKSTKQLKKENSQLKQDLKLLKTKFVEELGKIQPIVQQIQNLSQRIKQLQQLNMEYKIVMGDQQVQIAALQSQIGQKDSKGSNLHASFYGEHLNIVVNKDQQMNNQHKIEKSQFMKQSYIQKQSQKQNNKKQQNNQKLKNFHNTIQKALQMQVNSLRAQIDDLKTQNQSLNQELINMMKDTEDRSVQAQEEESKMMEQVQFNPNYVLSEYHPNQVVSIKQQPKQGQFRLFMPYSKGMYIAATINQYFPDLNDSTKYHNLQSASQIFSNDFKPYILDLNCLTQKGQQLLQQCTFVIIIKVSKIQSYPNKHSIQGQIHSVLGFDDNEMKIKDYASLIK